MSLHKNYMSLCINKSFHFKDHTCMLLLSWAAMLPTAEQLLELTKLLFRQIIIFCSFDCHVLSGQISNIPALCHIIDL